MSEASALPVPSTGRRDNGTFTPGHEFSKGKPRSSKVQRLRGGLLKAVSPADLRDVVKRLIEAAKGGDVSAAKLLFDRLLGPPLGLDIEERLAALEEKLGQEN